MGGFYGSVQIRGDDAAPVRTALEDLARKKKRKYLLGPTLDGWVGVYPEGGGQDSQDAHDLARRVGGEVFGMLVHDDDIFAYEYYRDGKLVDQYNSVPDYFGPVSEKEKRGLRGRPETFAHLATDAAKFEALCAQLAEQATQRVAFAYVLLEAFADALGIRNAVTSYEYLKENEETDDIERWDNFVHVPDLSHEQAKKQQANAALTAEKERLTREGRLLAERGGRPGVTSPSPWFCPAPDGSGFLVAWSSHADPNESQTSVELHGPPWSLGPKSTSRVIGSCIFGLALSPSGRYLAVAHAAGAWKATLWDLQENQLVAESPQVRAVVDVGFLPDESAMFSVSSHGAEGQVVITPVDGSEARRIPVAHAKVAAVHPSGSSLAVVDNLNRLLVIDLASGDVQRTRFIGGRYVPSLIERQMAAQVEAQMANVDPDALEQQIRQQYESMFSMFSKAPLPQGIGSADALKKQMEEQLEEHIRQMRAQFAQARSPTKQVQEERGTEGVFRIRFEPSGEHLCMATMAGVRAYSWQEILRADGDLRRPALAVDVSGSTITKGGASVAQGGYVYDLEHDPDRNRLLFAGLDGRVRFLDLGTGRSGILLQPPGLPAILRVALSRDGTTLALVSHAAMLSNSRNRPGPVIQFWDYRVLDKTSLRIADST